MKNKPTYLELENKIAEIQKQNETLRLNAFNERKAKNKCAAELILANIELQYQGEEKEKRAEELKIANIVLEHESGEKEKRAAELITANIELQYQGEEKEKRAEELKIANIELVHEGGEKEKRAAELIIANIELVFQNEEKAKRAAELIVSKIKFAKQNEEKVKIGEELITAKLAVALQPQLIQAKENAEKNEIHFKELNATKDKFYSLIAHDLRSPFNTILGLSEILIENVKNNEYDEVKKFLDVINLSTKNTLILLDNLLNWARSQTGQIFFKSEKLVLSAIIKEVLELLNPIAKNKNISLNYFQSEEIIVFADLNMIHMIIRNLISNAIKFTNLNGEINVYVSSKGKFIEIAVSDNGVGMNEETKNKLFELETNKSTNGTANEKGSGLGLILCKEFVEKQDGNIWVESELGKGSVFKFSLPLN